MNIQWNEYTWYSKLSAVVLFFAVLPVWTFYLGMRYQEARGIYAPTLEVPGALSTSPSNNDKAELVETKFKLFILGFWQVDRVIANPLNKSQFYFVTNTNGGGGDIWMYDISKDSLFQKTGNIGFTEGNSNLYNRPLKQYMELRSVGIVDNKFVFFETYNDDSPGPCFSDWLRGHLEYIDIGLSGQDAVAKPYDITSEMRQAETEKALECQKGL